MMVKVIYSPGYGAGLWHLTDDLLRSEPAAVKAVEEQDQEAFDKTVLGKCLLGNGYRLNPIDTLEVQEVEKGCVIHIREYDGFERIVYGSDYENESWEVRIPTKQELEEYENEI